MGNSSEIMLLRRTIDPTAHYKVYSIVSAGHIDLAFLSLLRLKRPLTLGIQNASMIITGGISQGVPMILSLGCCL